MNVADNLDMDATLAIYIQPIDGPRFKYFEGQNKITDKARAHLMHLVADSPAVYSLNPITHFRVGSGGVGANITGAETSLATEIAPAGNYTDTAIARSFSSSDRMCTFTFELGPDDAIGLAISEVGMFADNYWLGSSGNGKMFNIKAFPEVIKTSAFSLVFVWKVNFSGVYA